MEQKTCTIRLEDKSTAEKGILFFSEGELLDARVNNLKGESAAYKIFSWEEVNLSIQNGYQSVAIRLLMHMTLNYMIRTLIREIQNLKCIFMFQ